MSASNGLIKKNGFIIMITRKLNSIKIIFRATGKVGTFSTFFYLVLDLTSAI